MKTICLRDRGGRAKILPEFGLNCVDLTLRDGSETVPVLWAPEGFAKGKQQGYLGGLPVLFPFPGRIRDGAFCFRGRTYRLPVIDGMGNALHGQVVNRPWKVTACSETRVEARFRASEGLGEEGALPEENWPADYEVAITYEIRGSALKCTFEVRNLDQKMDLPCGLGLHPYLRIPVGNGSEGACTVTVPAGSVWELDSRLNPTGRRVPVQGKEDLRRGKPFSDLELDHVFGDLMFRNHVCKAAVHDNLSGKTLWLMFSDVFRHCVVFTPPHRQAICIEPYTCVPDPFTLEERGVDTGLRTLSPGESFQGWVAVGIHGDGLDTSGTVSQWNTEQEGGGRR